MKKSKQNQKQKSDRSSINFIASDGESLTVKYFRENRHQPVYEMGARVFGITDDGFPFVGSVGNDTCVNEEEGPYLHIYLDLPMVIDHDYYEHIFVRHDNVQCELEEINYENSSADNE